MNTATVNLTSTAGTGVSSNRTIWMCERLTRFPRSRGIFFGDNPLSNTLPVLALQSSLVGLLATCLQLLLTPLGQSSFFPQMLVIIVIFCEMYISKEENKKPSFDLELSFMYRCIHNSYKLENNACFNQSYQNSKIHITKKLKSI